MTSVRSFLARLGQNQAGAMLIESAIVTPVLILLSLGAYQVSTLVARDSELVGAMAEAESMVLAAELDTEEKRATLKEILVDSTDIPADNISVLQAFRCDASTSYVMTNSCEVGSKVSSYIKITIEDTYNPIWLKFGIGEPFDYQVERYIMTEQATKT
jgi:Flp pilus assembly protein TadG